MKTIFFCMFMIICLLIGFGMFLRSEEFVKAAVLFIIASVGIVSMYEDWKDSRDYYNGKEEEKP